MKVLCTLSLSFFTLWVEASRDCNAPIRVVTAGEIQNVTKFLLSVADANSDEALAVQSNSIKYDILVSKVCGSCDQYAENYQGNDGWSEFCGSDVYGHDAVHSGLVMHPLDPETGAPFGAELNVVYNYVSTRLVRSEAPSVSFPEADFSSFLASAEFADQFFTTIDIVVPMVAASAGATSIIGDSIGFGESENFTMSFFHPVPYQQNAVVTTLAAEQYTDSVSEGCTKLSRTVTVAGYSIGSYAALVATAAMKQTLGSTIHAVFVGSNPSDPLLVAYFTAVFYASGQFSGPDAVGFTGLLLHTYSDDDQNYVSSASSPQTLADSSFLDPFSLTKNIGSWFSPGLTLDRDILFGFLPSDAATAASMFNPTFLELSGLSFLETGGEVPVCFGDYVNANISDVCAALLSASSIPFYSEFDESTPISYCHSPEDDIVPFDPFGGLNFVQPNVVAYEAPIAELTATGSHIQGHVLCNTNPLNFFTTDDGVFNAMTPLPCPTQAPSVMPAEPTPTSSPVASPTSGSRPMGAIGSGLLLSLLVASLMFLNY